MLLDAGVDIVDFERKIIREDGDPDIEFDIETESSIIEVTTAVDGKVKQVRRRFDPILNPVGKKSLSIPSVTRKQLPGILLKKADT